MNRNPPEAAMLMKTPRNCRFCRAIRTSRAARWRHESTCSKSPHPLCRKCGRHYWHANLGVHAKRCKGEANALRACRHCRFAYPARTIRSHTRRCKAQRRARRG